MLFLDTFCLILWDFLCHTLGFFLNLTCLLYIIVSGIMFLWVLCVFEHVCLSAFLSCFSLCALFDSDSFAFLFVFLFYKEREKLWS